MISFKIVYLYQPPQENKEYVRYFDIVFFYTKCLRYKKYFQKLLKYKKK